MMRRGRSLSITAWTLGVACSGGGNETSRSASTGDEAGAESPPPAAAPAQSQSPNRGTVPMRIAAKVAGKTYQSTGSGECAGSGEASIYEVPATLWHAIYEGPDGSEVRRLNLTVWRPKAGGADMMGLSLETGETTHEIATVKGGRMAGSGTPGVRPVGEGGTLTVAGTDDHGDAIELSVECERFDQVVAEGG
jgi:hypothetical protein